MKITNETCYSTEDLAALFKRCKETYELCKIRSEEKEKQNVATATFGGGSYRQQLHDRLPPAELRVGYYQPSTSYRTYKFINPGGYGGGSRLGIVKRSALDINALTALAQAADGAGLTLPLDVVKELVIFFTSLIGTTWGVLPWGNRHGNGDTTDYADLWAWVETFQVSYNLRAKRGSKAQVRHAREVAKLTHLIDTLQYQENEVTCLDVRLKYAKSNLASQKKQITDLSKKLGV